MNRLRPHTEDYPEVRRKGRPAPVAMGTLMNAPRPGFLKQPDRLRDVGLSSRVLVAAGALGVSWLAGCASSISTGQSATMAAPVATVAPAVSRAVSDSVRAVIDRAIADSAFPGAYAVVGTREGIIAEYGAGRLDADDATRPTSETIWDLASLTKVIGTTSAMLQLVGSGKVVLDSPVVRYLPEWTGRGADKVSVRQLLSHNSGLQAGRLFYKEAATADEAFQQLFATAPDTAPGVRYTYSDIGFLLLGRLVARVSGEKLDAYDAAHIFGPLGMRDTRYLPPTSWLPRIAPTEQDPWRGRKVRGEVHDENAHRMGGVVGHAGLFSSARDLSRFARMYLNYGQLDGARVFDSATVVTFTRLQNPAISHRALGWEKPNGTNSAGKNMSPSAFGHTGFTGTSIWMDPEQNLFVLLLTNRVNPTRENRKIGNVRTGLADAVVGALH
ncbi:MAG TPA: serine hydrolase domain-containing protein [Gemmatimonas sp.]|uniref:serine hydrolase domain-containing protein n=1 Tax=Gemmatimonas sp. TaxID=1962908 RepID=UPI002EDA74C7